MIQGSCGISVMDVAIRTLRENKTFTTVTLPYRNVEHIIMNVFVKINR